MILMLPELYLGFVVVVFLFWYALFQIFSQDKHHRRIFINIFHILFMVYLYCQSNLLGSWQEQLIFGNLFFISDLLTLFKFMLGGLLYVLLLLFTFEIVKIEEWILVVISFLGYLIALSSNNLLVLFLGWELASMSFYVLVTNKRFNIYSIEAGLKYFLYGAFSSGLFLLGLSYLYGFSGMIGLREIGVYIQFSSDISISLLLILVSFMIKIGLFPFHYWVPDVYEGTSSFIVGLLSIFSKVVYLMLLIFVFYLKLGVFLNWIVIYMLWTVVFTVFVGIIGGFLQVNLYRIVAFSGFVHLGFMLSSFVLCMEDGLQVLLFYMAVYVVMMVNFIGILKLIRQQSLTIIKFLGLWDSNRYLCVSLIVLLFSLVGIPPLLGFVSKLFVLRSLLENSYYILSIYLISFSVIGSLFYLRIIVVMFFIDNYVKFAYARLVRIVLVNYKIDWVASHVISVTFWLIVTSIMFSDKLWLSLFILVNGL
uniref:NADH dehydrogenase subunit 2 n=1 Tax=Sphaerothecum destruens TaxID=42893 RepID=A0A6H2U3E2_9EUKA|nr:NADH dehydrogenase subunit 2 [Sphaerothecum destruens]QID02689.1 NADH dehydrogenase subunit 2 [Sphaerothecum destruens]